MKKRGRKRELLAFEFWVFFYFLRELWWWGLSKMEGFKELWEHMQSMDRTSEKVAYGAGVAVGTAGIAAGVVFGSKMAFDWVVDRCDEFETRTIERIMRKIDANRRNGNKEISQPSAAMLPEPKSDGI